VRPLVAGALYLRSSAVGEPPDDHEKPPAGFPVASDRSRSRVTRNECHAVASIGRRVSSDVAPATGTAIEFRDDRNRPLLPFKFVPMKGGNAQTTDVRPTRIERVPQRAVTSSRSTAAPRF
jgi:hypothetical protein